MEAINLKYSSVRNPSDSDKVHKRQCLYSFDGPLSEDGLFVSLHNWRAFGKKFIELGREKGAGDLFLRIKHVLKPKPEPVEGEPETTPTTLAIGVEGGFDPSFTDDKYNESHFVYDAATGEEVPFPSDGLHEKIVEAAQSIIAHADATVQERAQAWRLEDEMVEYKDADKLFQKPSPEPIGPGPWKCAKCDLQDHLWLNLSDGFIGCGRRFYDGSGGNNHAADHYEETGRNFHLVVKMGTISATGADVCDYATGDMVGA